MSRAIWIVFFVAAISSKSVQEPSLFKSTFKGLTGLVSVNHVRERGETRAVYFYEQTVAVVDLGKNNDLHNCNLIEVYEPSEANEVLRNLSTAIYPQQVSFAEIRKLMQQCEQLDKLQDEQLPVEPAGIFESVTRITKSSLSLLSGIIPGTKWCGAGDIAENYHDLGQEIQMDRCCRSHDLCPVKVRAKQTRYDLTNNSIYTKSHCSCDKAFYNCLKSAKRSTADVVGNLYFNILRVECIEDVPNEYNSREVERRFIPTKRSF